MDIHILTVQSCTIELRSREINLKYDINNFPILQSEFSW